VIRSCEDDWKQHIPFFGAPEPAWKLMRRVKTKLDPQNLLNPGRFLDCE